MHMKSAISKSGEEPNSQQSESTHDRLPCYIPRQPLPDAPTVCRPAPAVPPPLKVTTMQVKLETIPEKSILHGIPRPKLPESSLNAGDFMMEPPALPPSRHMNKHNSEGAVMGPPALPPPRHIKDEHGRSGYSSSTAAVVGRSDTAMGPPSRPPSRQIKEEHGFARMEVQPLSQYQHSNREGAKAEMGPPTALPSRNVKPAAAAAPVVIDLVDTEPPTEIHTIICLDSSGSMRSFNRKEESFDCVVTLLEEQLQNTTSQSQIYSLLTFNEKATLHLKRVALSVNLVERVSRVKSKSTAN